MAKTLAIILGIVFVVLSLLAFISNPLIGTNGFFLTDTTYDIVYLVFGIVLLIAAGAGEASSMLWLKIIGIIEILFFLDGLLQSSSLFSFITSNMNDTWLNLVLGVILLIVGYTGKSKMMETNSTSPTSM